MILLIQEDLKLIKLKKYKKNALKRDIYNNRKIECCPVCRHKHYIKYGKFNGVQRYRCKICGKTFSNATNAIWSYSKKDAEKWIKFIELMIEKKSLSYCAKQLNINVVTAFYWRHKILHGLEIDVLPGKLSGYILMRKIMIKENFKGSRNIPINAVLNERKSVWIVGAKDAEDFMIIRPICKGFWNLKSFNEKIYCHIEKRAYIITYRDTYLRAVGRKHNKRAETKKNRELYGYMEKKEEYHFLLNLRPWLASYRGVATKYLHRYFKFFALFDVNKKIDYMDMMHHLLTKNRFIRTGEIREV